MSEQEEVRCIAARSRGDSGTIDLLSIRKELHCGSNLFEGAAGISEELAAQLVTDPEDFFVAFFGAAGELIAGTLQVGNPDTAPIP